MSFITCKSKATKTTVYSSTSCFPHATIFPSFHPSWDFLSEWALWYSYTSDICIIPLKMSSRFLFSLSFNKGSVRFIGSKVERHCSSLMRAYVIIHRLTPSHSCHYFLWFMNVSIFIHIVTSPYFIKRPALHSSFHSHIWCCMLVLCGTLYAGSPCAEKQGREHAGTRQ